MTLHNYTIVKSSIQFTALQILEITAVAEKTFRAIKSMAVLHPDMHFIAVSHSDTPATEKWLSSVEGPGQVGLLVDSDRKLYAQWGLGVSSFGTC